MDSKSYDELRILSSGLYAGENLAGQLCPFCRGGRTEERSLSVTKLPSGAVLYICHRAACKRTGRLGGSVGLHNKAELTARSTTFTPRIYDGQASDALPDMARVWLQQYGLQDSECCRWDAERNRTVWEVRSPSGTLRGFELRSIGEDRPKTLHYRHNGQQPWLGHYAPVATPDGGPSSGLVEPGGRPLVAVEDVISATKVSLAGYNAASLMGTNLNLDKLIDLLSVSELVVLALDRDATSVALGFAKRYALLAPSLVVMPLVRDLKYEDSQTITSMIEDIIL